MEITYYKTGMENDFIRVVSPPDRNRNENLHLFEFYLQSLLSYVPVNILTSMIQYPGNGHPEFKILRWDFLV